jgi:hypothetical protein
MLAMRARQVLAGRRQRVRAVRGRSVHAGTECDRVPALRGHARHGARTGGAHRLALLLELRDRPRLGGHWRRRLSRVRAWFVCGRDWFIGVHVLPGWKISRHEWVGFVRPVLYGHVRRCAGPRRVPRLPARAVAERLGPVRVHALPRHDLFGSRRRARVHALCAGNGRRGRGQVGLRPVCAWNVRKPSRRQDVFSMCRRVSHVAQVRCRMMQSRSIRYVCLGVKTKH